jgi:hypothetical protein
LAFRRFRSADRMPKLFGQKSFNFSKIQLIAEDLERQQRCRCVAFVDSVFFDMLGEADEPESNPYS